MDRNILMLIIPAMLLATNVVEAAATQSGETIIIKGKKLHQLCAERGLVVGKGSHGQKDCVMKPETKYYPPVPPNKNYPPVPPNKNPWEKGKGGNSKGKKPSMKQCKKRQKSCSSKVSNFVSQCVNSAREFHQKELDAGRPCHGQSPEKLLEGVNRYPSGIKRGECTNSNYKNYPKCMRFYQSRGMDRCMYATPRVSSGSSTGDKVVLNFKWGGVGVTHISKITTTFGGHEGSIASCQKAGLEAKSVCEKSYKKCSRRANK